jgi:hypothetical protein
MLDFSHLPNIIDQKTYIIDISFTQMTWNKPRNCTMVYIQAWGLGGDGGNGYASATTSQRRGGGGGGGGTYSQIMIPSLFLPDSVIIIGETVVTVNLTTKIIKVKVNSFNSELDLLLQAGHGQGGSNATSGTSGAAGGGGATVTQQTNFYSGAGAWSTLAGQAGTDGRYNASSGNNVSSPTTGLLTTGGAGGVGYYTANVNGGTVSGGGFTTPASTSHGSNGIHEFRNQLMFSTGGAGGGYRTSGAIGGDGGAPGIGSGGGGGAGGTTGEAGIGGTYGPGRVIITAW